MKRLPLTFVALWASVAFAQYAVTPGKYEEEARGRLPSELSVVRVERPQGETFKVTGEIRRQDIRAKTIVLTFAGTMVARGRLQGKILSPAYATSGLIEGYHDLTNGYLRLDVTAPLKAGAKPERFVILLRNKDSKPENEIVWVLIDGRAQPNRDYKVRGSDVLDIDPVGGTVLFPKFSYREGKPVPQKLTFTVPAKEYRPNEKFTVTIDATATDKEAIPRVAVVMEFGWRPGGWIGASNDKSDAMIQSGHRPTGEVIFNPEDESKAYIVVHGPGYGGYVWEYQRITRLKSGPRPAESKPKADEDKPKPKPTVPPAEKKKTDPKEGKPSSGVLIKRGEGMWAPHDGGPLLAGDHIETGADAEFELKSGSSLAVLLPKSGIEVLSTAGGVMSLRLKQGHITVENGSGIKIQTPQMDAVGLGDYSLRFDSASKTIQISATKGGVKVTVPGEGAIEVREGETWVRSNWDQGVGLLF